MVTHIVAWSFKDEVPMEERESRKTAAAENLLSLKDKVPGIIDCSFVSNMLPSSNRDMALIVNFKDAESLAVYAKHPEHVKVADTYVRPFVKDRAAIDFEN